MQLLNKNECQKSFVSKAFKGIVINDNLPQAQHQMYMACTPPPPPPFRTKILGLGGRFTDFFFRGRTFTGGGLYTITCHNADRRYSVTTEQETTLFTKLITITVK